MHIIRVQFDELSQNEHIHIITTNIKKYVPLAPSEFLECPLPITLTSPRGNYYFNLY